MVEETQVVESENIITNIFTSPLNLALLAICAYLLYKIFKPARVEDVVSAHQAPQLPLLKKQDFSMAQLREYDGIKNDGRVLIAVNGKVFDVTRGKSFYGPEGPYALFAGRDASRGLAQFRLDKEAIKDEYDDLSDLSPMELESVREWDMQFSEKYILVGRLLKAGEEPTDYSDFSENENSQDAKNKDD